MVQQISLQLEGNPTKWTNSLEGRSLVLSSNEYGPNVSTTYILGHYLEDYAYKGDLGLKQGSDFDLDDIMVACVTPDFQMESGHILPLLKIREFQYSHIT